MMRLDKFLCDNNIGSRSQVKELIKKGLVCINGTIVTKADFKVNETKDEVFCQGQTVIYSRFVYYMFNKPQGTVTAHHDKLSCTVMSYFKDAPAKDLSPVGRLDKDTEGLLLVTNDGELNHKLLMPKSHVPKTYYVELRDSFTDKQKEKLISGIDIGEKRPCMPAKAEIYKQSDTGKAILLTIHEGMYHQVKRMMQAVGNEVVYLKRIRFGSLCLDASLAPGSYRLLSDNEIEALKNDIINNYNNR